MDVTHDTTVVKTPCVGGFLHSLHVVLGKQHCGGKKSFIHVCVCASRPKSLPRGADLPCPQVFRLRFHLVKRSCAWRLLNTRLHAPDVLLLC